jgi:hypothetical protein
MQQLSTVGRPIDFRYKTNRAIFFATCGVILVAAIIRFATGSVLLDGTIWGVKAGIAVFLTWALCRELDPDHDLSAFVAAFLLLGSLSWIGLPSLVLLFWMLIASRIVNRTTGAAASILDSFILLALATWLTRQFGVAILLLTAGTFLLDAWIGPRTQRQFAMAVLAIAAAVSTILLQWTAHYGEQSPNSCLVALAFCVVFTPVFIGASKVKTMDDKSIARLHPLRIQSAQVMALLSGILLALLLGETGLKSCAPLWAIAVGAPLFWAIGKLWPKKRLD